MKKLVKENLYIKDFDFKIELTLTSKDEFSRMSTDELESFIKKLIETYCGDSLKIRSIYTSKY